MLNWKERKVNDIETNPLECWYAVGFVGESPRLYQIEPQYPNPNGDGYTVDTSKEPELYILFETLGGEHFSKTRYPEDGTSWLGLRLWEDYTFEKPRNFVRAFNTIEEAKERAETQISAIQNIIDIYSPKENK